MTPLHTKYEPCAFSH